VNKHVLILSTMHKHITVADKKRKHLKVFPHTIKPNTESIYLTKCLRYALAEPAHEGGQYVVFQNTLDLAAITAWVLYIGVRGGGSGRGCSPPGLKKFRANSVFRASATC